MFFFFIFHSFTFHHKSDVQTFTYNLCWLINFNPFLRFSSFSPSSSPFKYQVSTWSFRKCTYIWSININMKSVRCSEDMKSWSQKILKCNEKEEEESWYLKHVSKYSEWNINWASWRWRERSNIEVRGGRRWKRLHHSPSLIIIISIFPLNLLI